MKGILVGAAACMTLLAHRAYAGPDDYVHLPAVTYISTADEATATLYISPQVKDLLGFTAAEWLKR